jgi:hypothetical protein
MTTSMEQSSSGEDTREIFHPLWKREVHYRVHKTSPQVPILSQINPILALKSYNRKVRLNIVLQSTLGFSKWSLQVFQSEFCTHFLSPDARHVSFPYSP